MTSVWDKKSKARYIDIVALAIDLQITEDEVIGIAQQLSPCFYDRNSTITMALAKKVTAEKYQQVVGEAYIEEQAIASMPFPSHEFNRQSEEFKKRPTMTWKNTNEFDCDSKLIIQEVYKGHEISIATDERGHQPGIKVYKAPEGKITSSKDKPVDVTKCFRNVDAALEIPFSMMAIKEIMDQIDAWDGE